jgi:hypothetical protein
MYPQFTMATLAGLPASRQVTLSRAAQRANAAHLRTPYLGKKVPSKEFIASLKRLDEGELQNLDETCK